MKSIDELREYFNEQLKPELDKLDLERLKIRKLFKSALIAGVLGLVVSILLLCSGLPIAFTITILIISIGVPLVLSRSKRGNYSSMIKDTIVKKVVEFSGETLYYNGKMSITQDEYMSSRIFSRDPDVFKGSDYISGKIDKTDFRLCELHTKEKHTDSDGNTTYTTIFKGLFIIADFHKNFKGSTIILTEVAEKIFGSMIGNFFNSIGRSGHLVKLENPDFEKEFVVYSTDQVEARYLLSTSMMERIVNLKKSNEGKPVQMSFVNNKLYIAMNEVKNLFESKLKEPLNDFKTIERYYMELLFAVNFVEELNLNTRIWDKE